MQAVRAARRSAEREVGDLTPELPSWCLCGALLDRRRRAQRWSSTASGVWRRIRVGDAGYQLGAFDRCPARAATTAVDALPPRRAVGSGVVRWAVGTCR